uniref:Uncharacterized protein n=1 Tax=Cannabis sativa TaxID=3483 RepID=A0A803QGD9_CANSA
METYKFSNTPLYIAPPTWKSKIDRVLANLTWLDLHPIAEVIFQTEGLLDHSLAVLTVFTSLPGGKKPFRYLRMWSSHPEYNSLAKEELDVCQVRLHQNPLNPDLQNLEVAARVEFATVQAAYTYFLQQKAKLLWLKDGDTNSAFYHNSIHARRSQNQILSIMDSNGVTSLFLDYYNQILGREAKMSKFKKSMFAAALGALVYTLWSSQMPSSGKVKITIVGLFSNRDKM